MSPAEYTALRECLGLSQDQLAKLLGLSREAINRREKGGRITEEMALALRALTPRKPKRPAPRSNVKDQRRPAEDSK
jgi:transcriptional regulator with XRE-family HTH domain